MSQPTGTGDSHMSTPTDQNVLSTATTVDSLSSDIDSLDSQEDLNYDDSGIKPLRVDQYNPETGLKHTATTSSHLSRINSVGSSIVQIVSRVNSLSKTVSQSVAGILEQARDDNLQTNKEKQVLKSTKAGRVMTNFDLDDALRMASKFNESGKIESHTDRARARANTVESSQTLRKRITKTSIVDPEMYKTITQAFGEDEDEENLKPSDLENAIPSPEEKKEETQEEKVIERGKPDEGYCWVVAICSCLLLFSTWGSSAGYGVFLGFFLQEDRFPGATAIDFALVGSIILCLAQALAPVAIILTAVIGYKPTMVIGLCVQSAGYILCSFATRLWHIYVCLGFMVGLGFALVINPGIVILPSWFDKYRATASGITVMGTGLGGVVFTLSSQALIDQTKDYKWSARMVGIVVFVVNIFVTIFLKERLPTKRLKTWKAFKERVKLVINLEICKSFPVWCVTFWLVFGQVSYIIISYSLNAYASAIGLSQRQGSHITSIFNASQIFGRLSIGYLGDKFGRSNVGFIISLTVAIFILCMWPFCKSFVSLLFFAIISGSICAVANTLHISLLSSSVPAYMYPAAWSLENFVVGCFCLLGEPVSIKLRTIGSSYPFLKSQIFSGFLIGGGAFCILPLREWRIRKVLEIRLENTENQLSNMCSQSYKAILLEERRQKLENLTSDSSETDGEEKKSASPAQKPSGLLQDEEAYDVDESILIRRRFMYRKLLASGSKGYFIRMCYPIRI
ncbi:hypothetical protein B5S32_g1213 [[Candida] boidinii]|nr:hypothetical protein B5S32_g1213 [[Candida] boidinii]